MCGEGGSSFSGGFSDTLTNVSANIIALVSYFQFSMTMTQSQIFKPQPLKLQLQIYSVTFSFVTCQFFLESLLFYKEVLPNTMKKEHYYSFLNRQEQIEDLLSKVVGGRS